MQYVLNYRVPLGDSSEHMLKMSSSSLQAQLYSSHHILCDTRTNCRSKEPMPGPGEFITSSNHWMQGLGYRMDDD